VECTLTAAWKSDTSSSPWTSLTTQRRESQRDCNAATLRTTSRTSASTRTLRRHHRTTRRRRRLTPTTEFDDCSLDRSASCASRHWTATTPTRPRSARGAFTRYSAGYSSVEWRPCERALSDEVRELVAQFVTITHSHGSARVL